MELHELVTVYIDSIPHAVYIDSMPYAAYIDYAIYKLGGEPEKDCNHRVSSI